MYVLTIFYINCGSILVAVLAALGLVSKSLKVLTGMCNVLWLCNGILSTIQTMGIGCLKNKKTLQIGLTQFLVDQVRIALFYTTLKAIGTQILSQSGLGYLYSLFVFLIYFLIFAWFSGLGEIYTNLRSRDRTDVPLWPSVFLTCVVGILAWIGRIL